MQDYSPAVLISPVLKPPVSITSLQNVQNQTSKDLRALENSPARLWVSFLYYLSRVGRARLAELLAVVRVRCVCVCVLGVLTFLCRCQQEEAGGGGGGSLIKLTTVRGDTAGGTVHACSLMVSLAVTELLCIA